MFERTRRHFAVWKAAVAEERARPKQPKRNAEEIEFLPAALELLDRPPSPAGRWVLWLLILFFVGAATWSWFGHIDVHATAEGRVIPTGRVKVIEPFETGIVREIHVREGDRVKAGDLLVELDPTEAGADRDRLAQDLRTAELEIRRLEATIAAVDWPEVPLAELSFAPDADAPEVLVDRQTALMRSAIAAFRAAQIRNRSDIARQEAQRRRVNASIARRKEMVQVMEKRAASRQRLADTGVGSQAALLEMQQQIFEEQAILAGETGSLGEIAAAIEALKRDGEASRAEFLAELHQELAETEKRAAAVEQELIKAENRNRRSELSAPVGGTVQQLAVHTRGDVVQTGEQLMIIVPGEGGLEVEAFVLNRDKGFVVPGQDVEVKFEAFSFTKYGTIDGRLRAIAEDAVENERLGLVFPARVALDQLHMTVKGNEIALTPGMSVTVEVKTGERRVIEFLLTPLLRYREEAFRER